MSKLVKNLVMLSRLDEGMPLPDKSDFSLSDAAWEAAEPFEMRAKAQGKSYSQNIAPDLNMTGDMAAVQQLISILLDNAFKYSDDGGEIRLSVCAQHKIRLSRSIIPVRRTRSATLTGSSTASTVPTNRALTTAEPASALP